MLMRIMGSYDGYQKQFFTYMITGKFVTVDVHTGNSATESMSLSDPQARPSDVFANVRHASISRVHPLTYLSRSSFGLTGWYQSETLLCPTLKCVSYSVIRSTTPLMPLQAHGGRVVGLIQEARFAIVRSAMSEDLQRIVSPVGIPCVVPSWISQSLERGTILPTNSYQPSGVAAALAVPPVSTLQKESSSVSGESTVVESPAHMDSRRPTANGETSPNSNGSPTEPNFEANAGESEIDELDQSIPVDSPNRRRRGKAYSQEDIAAMQNHYRQQMELTPKPSHSAIWDAFAQSVSHLLN